MLRTLPLFLICVLLLPSPAAGATDCCTEHTYAGCDDWWIESCVCGDDPYCCETKWDKWCVQEVEDWGCGSCQPTTYCGDGWCDADEDCTTCPDDCGSCQGSGDCCEPQATPGCGDGWVQDCVCAQDSYCCQTKWDQLCANEVEEFGCGSCSQGPVCGDGVCDAGEDCANCSDDCGPCGGSGSCCEEQATPGCDDAWVQQCVCDQDPYCCQTKWDQWCVKEVDDFGCGSCATGPDCGDGTCEAGEDCSTCPADCGPCGGSGSCCEVQETPGCDDAWVQQCVCDQDPYCCQTKWDKYCVSEVESYGCGSCSQGPVCGNGACEAGEDCSGCPDDCGPCGGDSGSCCEVHETPGCQDPAVRDCVCAQDSYCCEVKWDKYCVSEVDSYGCGSCAGGPTCGDGNCDADEDCSTCKADCGPCGGSGSCCQEQATPGCDDAQIQECVCAQDSYCCSTKWDKWCVQEVEDYGCGSCEAGPVCGDGNCDPGEDCKGCEDDCGPCGGATGSCCEAHDTPGCKDPAVQKCVCAIDAYCCDVKWDSICVGEVEGEGCGSCAAGETCGDGACGAGETCDNCPDDCGACPGQGDCCEAKQTPGCDEAAVQNCVCAQDSYCCDVKWDSICAGEVTSLGCGSCEAGPKCGNGKCEAAESCTTCEQDCGPCDQPGDCCHVQQTKGCNDPTIQACVCAQDSFCCNYSWDQICVNEVEELGCGSCSGGGCGDGACGVDEDCTTCPEDCGPCGGASCCEAHDTPSCDDAAVAECVCAGDAYCCNTMWDGICVGEVTSMGCGSCDGGPFCGNGKCEAGEGCQTCPKDCGQCPGTEDCCHSHDTPGCDDGGVQQCVCAVDAYCCDVKWDDICVGEVESEGCGSCQECKPNCVGKQCGGDGCGGSCGTCKQGMSCKDGHCVDPGGCKPNCTGKVCGDDGCGGSCGNCPVGKECHNGKCLGGCQPNCAGKQCGDDGCGGSCGNCPQNFFCDNGHCVKTCNPNCAGKQCGADGCGGSCGTCAPNLFCTAQGHCEAQCKSDCTGKQCGDDGCGGICGSCPFDMKCQDGHCVDSCVKDCTGKQCGADGCGGQCGSCNPGDYCNLQGHCVTGCVPNCAGGKQCGSDGCGGSCGSCGFTDVCNAQGLCVPKPPDDECVPDCHDVECGDNGCGGSCGTCGVGTTCNEEQLCEACQKECEGKECGDDGCGGSCGTCPDELVCHEKAGLCLEADDPAFFQDDAYTIEEQDKSIHCQPGYVPRYGKCIPADDSAEDEYPEDSGCSSARAGGPVAVLPSALLLLLLLIAPLRTLRRRP